MLSALQQPAKPGCSVANPGRSPGTLGCIVKDASQFSDTFILSAAHVIGNHTFDPLGLPVFQPRQESEPKQVLGVVARWGALEFSDAEDDFPNLFDAAVARVEPATVGVAIEAVGLVSGVNENVQERALVKKFGIATKQTFGIVSRLHVACWFKYTDNQGNAHRAGFQQQLLCTARDGSRTGFSEPGDSGAAVVDDDNRIIGLITGRVASGTIVCPIGPILSSLQVRLA